MWENGKNIGAFCHFAFFCVSTYVNLRKPWCDNLRLQFHCQYHSQRPTGLGSEENWCTLCACQSAFDRYVWTVQTDDPRARHCLAEASKLSSRLNIWLCRGRVGEPCNELQPVTADTNHIQTRTVSFPSLFLSLQISAKISWVAHFLQTSLLDEKKSLDSPAFKVFRANRPAPKSSVSL